LISTNSAKDKQVEEEKPVFHQIPLLKPLRDKELLFQTQQHQTSKKEETQFSQTLQMTSQT